MSSKRKELGSRLLACLEQGDVEKACSLLDDNVDLDVLSHGYNPIHLASRKGLLEVIQKLVQKGDKVNKRTERGNVPLHYAAREGHVEVVEYLINNGANCNVDNVDGKSPLHDAVGHQPMDVIEKFVKLGMAVNFQNKRKETPLHLAVLHNRQEAVEALLMCGADVNKPDKDGKIPGDMTKDEDLKDQIKTHALLMEAQQTGIIMAEGRKITPRKTRPPVTFKRVNVVLKNYKYDDVFPFLFYCRREKTENSGIKFPINPQEEVVSDIFHFRISDVNRDVSVQVDVPMYSKPSNTEQVVLRLLDGTEFEFNEMVENEQDTFVRVSLDLRPSSRQVLILLTRPKEETCVVDNEGTTLQSNITKEFVMEVPAGAFEEETKISMKVFGTDDKIEDDDETKPSAKHGTDKLEVRSKRPTKHSQSDRRRRERQKADVEDPLLLSDLYLVHIEGEQPKKKVELQIPLHESNGKSSQKRRRDSEIVIVSLDENNIIDKHSMEVVPCEPKRIKNSLLFSVSHFSIHVAVPMIKYKENKAEIFNKIVGSKDRKKAAVFLVMLQLAYNDEYLIVVECTPSAKSAQRREYWKDLGYAEQDLSETGEFMMEPYQEFDVQFDGNIKSANDGQRRLAFLPRRTSFQPYRLQLKSIKRRPVGEIKLKKMDVGVKNDASQVKGTEEMARLPLSLPVPDANSTGGPDCGVRVVIQHLILKDPSLMVLGRVLSRTKGIKLGTHLGLERERVRELQRTSESTSAGNFNILHKWRSLVMGDSTNLTDTMENTLIGALRAIGCGDIAAVVAQISQQSRLLSEIDFKNLEDSD